MEYTCEILIDRPRDKVTALFMDPDEVKNWQPGFVSFEPLTGKPGAEGSTARLKYLMGKSTMEMKETILKSRLPEEFHTAYDAKGVHNVVRNRFLEEGPNRTRIVSGNEFEFSGVFMKLMAFLMPGSFRKQSMVYLELLKKLCESK